MWITLLVCITRDKIYIVFWCDIVIGKNTATLIIQKDHHLITAPQSKNAVYDDQCSLISKGSIYYVKLMSIQPFTMGVDWRGIGHNGRCFTFAHAVFLLFTADNKYIGLHDECNNI